MKNDAYNFDISVQEDILRLMAQDSGFMSAAAHWVKPEYFSDETLRKTASFLMGFYDKYQIAPTLGQSKTELLRQYNLQSKKWDEFRSKIDSFYEDIPSSREYTIDIVSEFAQAQAWKSAMLEAIDPLKKGDFSKVNDLFQKAANIGGALDLGGYWYFETVEERVRRRSDEDEQEKDIIPTGIPELDYCFRLGGIGRGEIGLVVAPTNGGKSLSLGQFARRAVWEGCNVVIFSFEMAEAKMADRMDAGFTFTKMGELGIRSDALLKALSRMGQRFRESLWIKRFPTKGASLKDVRRSLEAVEKQKKWRPDMIILDYAAIIKPTRPREKKHLELQEILEESRGLCVDYNAAGWTAAQANRRGADAELVRGTHVAGSWDSLGICDYILTLNITEKEREQNLLRIFLEKNRDGIAKVEIGPLQSDFERMVIARVAGSGGPKIKIGGSNQVNNLSASMGIGGVNTDGMKKYPLKK